MCYVSCVTSPRWWLNDHRTPGSQPTRQDDMNAADWETRKAVGLTLGRFAAEVSLTLSTVNRSENMRSSPSPVAMRADGGVAEHFYA